MIEVARSSVQTWECDQMGHLNVQFYVAKADEGLAALARALGLNTRSHANTALVPVEQHIRFHREQRPGAPYVIHGGVLTADTVGLSFYQEMTNVATESVAATIVTRTQWCDLESRRSSPVPISAIENASALRVALPQHAAPRGLDTVPPYQSPKLSLAESLGLITTFRGCVLDEHCDRNGFMLLRHYMGRVSDSIPNLIAQTTGRDRSSGGIGGAALEYRFVFRAPARAGDLLVLKSGLKSISTKTYVWCHWLFDSVTGDCVATAEAVAISMDLNERKAIEIPDAMRAVLLKLVVPGLSA